MNNVLDRIRYHFSESIQTKINAADTLPPNIALAAEKIVQSLLDGHKIMSCGNGGSACEAMHFSSKMLNSFRQERPSLPAITLMADIPSLTAIANNQAYNDIFAKQLRALGQPGDTLLAISTSGNSINIINAIKAAHDRDIQIVAMTGYDGGKIAETLRDSDVEIRIPASDPARIQETHLLIIHCLCDIIDHNLFNHGENIL